MKLSVPHRLNLIHFGQDNSKYLNKACLTFTPYFQLNGPISCHCSPDDFTGPTSASWALILNPLQMALEVGVMPGMEHGILGMFNQGLECVSSTLFLGIFKKSFIYLFGCASLLSCGI